MLLGNVSYHFSGIWDKLLSFCSDLPKKIWRVCAAWTWQEKPGWSWGGVSALSMTVIQFLCIMRIINLADRQQGFGLIPLGQQGPPVLMEKVQAAGLLSPCSELLQHVPLEENSSTTQGHVWQDWWRKEGTQCKYQRCQESRYWEHERHGAKSRCRDRGRNLKQYFLSYSWLCFWLCFQASDL